ncbi:hypothetical protein ACH5RR_015554 [Cinchona calisaya]|uniref:Uncharacterized protein n=1 Tax=Cinchona calisaya TaxID=153742 RepID=A0ABD2ZWX9_9GENT
MYVPPLIRTIEGSHWGLNDFGMDKTKGYGYHDEETEEHPPRNRRNHQNNRRIQTGQGLHMTEPPKPFYDINLDQRIREIVHRVMYDMNNPRGRLGYCKAYPMWINRSYEFPWDL